MAFAKTIHTFQGANVGPTYPGQPPNEASHVIVFPGPRSFEGKNPGLLYTIVSRVTTIGVPEDKFSSAIYFDGLDATSERYCNITTGANGQPYEKVKQRQKWTEFLDKHCIPSSEIPEEKCYTTYWIEKNRLTQEHFEDLLNLKIQQWNSQMQ